MPGGHIIDFLDDLPDPREDNKWHKLVDIVVITIAASICGADKWDDVEIFGKAKEPWLRTFLELPHGIPQAKLIEDCLIVLIRMNSTSASSTGSRQPTR